MIVIPPNNSVARSVIDKYFFFFSRLSGVQEQEEGEERESPRDSGPLLQEIVRASRTHLRDTRIRGKPWIGYIYFSAHSRAKRSR